MIVADATVHAYNWSKENYAVPIADRTTAAGLGFHGWLTTDEASKLTEAEFRHDWTAEELEKALFYESPVDLAGHHGTPIWDYYKDGHSATEKGFQLRELQPNRTIVYGAVNPFHGQKCLEDVERLVEQGVDGIKVYAARYDQGVTYEQRLDDPEFGYPFIQKCVDLGVRVIATHKAVPFGPVRSEFYNVRDLPEVCAVFPQMNFEIVHAGFAFVEETAFLAGFPNVWLNLEFSAAIVTKAPRRVAEFIGKFATMGGADKILFSTTCAL
ncbi:MAG: amidohydrolase family protein, partial [Actinobacteria bacterium]|nr:amidohydrolase family protein [Actinomycetota bacterium]